MVLFITYRIFQLKRETPIQNLTQLTYEDIEVVALIFTFGVHPGPFNFLVITKKM